jgi:hypothetical protein
VSNNTKDTQNTLSRASHTVSTVECVLRLAWEENENFLAEIRDYLCTSFTDNHPNIEHLSAHGVSPSSPLIFVVVTLLVGCRMMVWSIYKHRDRGSGRTGSLGYHKLIGWRPVGACYICTLVA